MTTTIVNQLITTSYQSNLQVVNQCFSHCDHHGITHQLHFNHHWHYIIQVKGGWLSFQVHINYHVALTMSLVHGSLRMLAILLVVLRIPWCFIWSLLKGMSVFVLVAVINTIKMPKNLITCLQTFKWQAYTPHGSSVQKSRWGNTYYYVKSLCPFEMASFSTSTTCANRIFCFAKVVWYSQSLHFVWTWIANVICCGDYVLMIIDYHLVANNMSLLIKSLKCWNNLFS